MEMLWFTKHFHINLFYDIEDYSSILKMRKLRPGNINLLMVTQVEEPEFQSKSSYSYFQRMEHIGKCWEGGEFFGCREGWEVSEQDKLSGLPKVEPKGLQYPGDSKRRQETTKNGSSISAAGLLHPAQLREANVGE